MTTAVEMSRSAAGTDLRAVRGLASELAAPTQSSIAASRIASNRATARASSVTGPPRVTPAAHPGRATDGSVNSTVPVRTPPMVIWKNNRIPTITRARMR